MTRTRNLACAAAVLASLAILCASPQPCAAQPLPAAPQANHDIVLVVDTGAPASALSKDALEAIVERAGEQDRLCIVVMGGDGEAVLPLVSMGKDGKTRALKTLGALAFDAQYRDLAGGLTAALSQLTLERREGAQRAVVLVATGSLVPSADARSAEQILQELRDVVLYEYLIEKVPVHAIAIGSDPDLELMLEIATSTGGRTLVAPDVGVLADSMDLLAAEILMAGLPACAAGIDGSALGLAPGPASPGQSAEPPSIGLGGGIVQPLLLVLVLLVAATLALVTVSAARAGTLRGRGPAGRPRTGSAGSSSPEFAQIREKADRLARRLAETRSGIEGLNMDLEDWGAEAWQREKKLRKGWEGLATNVLLLMDHVEILRRDQPASGSSTRPGPDIEWVERKLAQILEQESIEQIPVDQGDRFDGRIHHHAGERTGGQGEPGTVAELARRGFWIRGAGAGGEDLVLRQAEVVVWASRPAAGGAAPGGKQTGR